MDLKQAKNRLMAECSKKELSEKQAFAKLQKWAGEEASKKELEKTIAELKEDKYIDDARFAECYVRDKVRFSGWGPVKIMMKLNEAGVKREVGQESIESEKELIENKLKSILAAKKKEIERKFGKKEGEDERTLKLKKKAALYSFAQQRGFTFDMIQKIEKEL